MDAPPCGMSKSARLWLSLHGLRGGVTERGLSETTRKGMALSGSGGAEEGRAWC